MKFNRDIYFFIVVVIGFILGIWLLFATNKAEATYVEECEYECEPSIEPSPEVTPEVTVTPEVAPEASPSAEPTVEPKTPPSEFSDGLHDGKSDGKSSCPDCTKAPVVPQGAPATGFGPTLIPVGYSPK